MEQVKLLIVGAGAAGLSAAMSAWDAGCRDILIADRSSIPGGVLPRCIHAGFGLTAFGEELCGPEYAERLLAGLVSTGVRLSLGTEVLSVSRGKTALLSCRGCVSLLHFEHLILASGCREKGIGALPVAGTRPAGIFTAGQAQEMINLRHQDLGGEVLILGSGDLGMIIARRFVLEGKHVIAVLEQADTFGGMARNYRRCIEAYQIPLRCRMTVGMIHGQGRISGVTAVHLDSGEQEFIACDTLVTALGLISERTLVQGLESSPWLSLAGNCSRVYDMVDSAVSQAQHIGREVGASLL